MNKIVVYCEPLNGNPEVESKFQKIREESLKSIDDLQQHWHDLNKIVPISIPKIKIKQLTFPQTDIVSTIENNENSSDIVVAIFHEERLHELMNSNWRKKINSRYIIEIVLDNAVTVNTHSKNCFSTCVKSDIASLKPILDDIFLDLLIEQGLEYDKDYSKIFSNISMTTYFKQKQLFLKMKLYLDNNSNNVNLKKNPFCFSTIFRDSNDDYNYSLLLNYWLIFMWKIALQNTIFIKPQKKKFPFFYNASDPIELLPGKLHGQMREIQYATFGEKSYKILLYQRRSVLGATQKTKDRIESLFKGRPTVNNVRILPYENFKFLNGLEHLLYVLPFKLIGE